MRCRSSWTGCGNEDYRTRTLGADRGYDTKDCVKTLRSRRVTPHVAQKKKLSAIDGHTTRQAGYSVSLRIRKRGRGGLRLDEDRRTRYRSVNRTGLTGYLVATEPTT